MPTLNYENVGALVEYDYLQGTITALYPEDDTADVSGVCGSLSKVPIFYHCKSESSVRSNGAITGASSGFAAGDSVVVLVGRDGTDSLGQKYYVVGHYDGVKTCGGELAAVSVVDYNADYHHIVWNMDTDDYWVHDYVTRESYPRYGNYPFIADRFTKIVVEYMTSPDVINFKISESNNLIAFKNIDFGMVKEGDYVYATLKPWLYSRVKIAAGGIIRLKDSALMSFLSSNTYYGVTISISLPIYVTSEAWIPNGGIGYGTVEQYNNGSHYCGYWDEYGYWHGVHGRWSWVGHDGMTSTHNDFISNTSEQLPKTEDSYNDYSQQYSGPGWPDCRYNTWTEISLSYSRHIIYEMRSNIPSALSAGYEKDYRDEYYRVETFHTDEWAHDLAVTRSDIDTTNGRLNPLTSNTEYGREYLDNYETSEFIRTGDIYNTTGELAVCTDTNCFQFYTYYGYNRNTVAQCVKRSSINSAPVSDRSAKLEEAIKLLISHANGDNKSLTVQGRYYSGIRSASFNSDIIALLNATRGFPPLLTEDTWCMTSSENVISGFIANGTCNHYDAEASGFYGAEVVAAAPDTISVSEVFIGWMESPAHAAAILGVQWAVAGYAVGTYPASISQIVFGPGMYNALAGTYTEGMTVQDIPIELRGHVKCYVVRMIP